MKENAFRQASIIPSSQAVQDVAAAALTVKQNQFNTAMELYNSGLHYARYTVENPNGR